MKNLSSPTQIVSYGQEYGKPTPLSAADTKLLLEMDQRIWVRSKDDFGFTHAFPKNRAALPKKDLEYVLGLIKEHVLPCILGSGPYGELWFAVYNHSEIPFHRPEKVISLSEDHFGLTGDANDWPRRFKEISKVTHSQRNKDVLAFYKLPTPGPASEYEY